MMLPACSLSPSRRRWLHLGRAHGLLLRDAVNVPASQHDLACAFNHHHLRANHTLHHTLLPTSIKFHRAQCEPPQALKRLEVECTVKIYYLVIRKRLLENRMCLLVPLVVAERWRYNPAIGDVEVDIRGGQSRARFPRHSMPLKPRPDILHC